MNQIRAKRPSISMSWMEAILFIMNVIRYPRDFLGGFELFSEPYLESLDPS